MPAALGVGAAVVPENPELNSPGTLPSKFTPAKPRKVAAALSAWARPISPLASRTPLLAVADTVLAPTNPPTEEVLTSEPDSEAVRLAPPTQPPIANVTAPVSGSLTSSPNLP